MKIEIYANSKNIVNTYDIDAFLLKVDNTVSIKEITDWINKQ